ncbi:MAG: tetratricopeptide repeat protein [Balneolaceae bacterium]
MIESNIREDIEQKIEDYIHGKLSAKEIDELWAELIEDDYYLDYLKSMAALKKILNENSRKKSKRFTLSTSSKWISAAAAILVIVGSFVVFDLSVQPSESIQPIAAIELDYYRSADGSASELEDEDTMRMAITEANQGNIDEALKMLDKQIEEATTDAEKAELMITAGSILYNGGRYSEAIDRFENAISLNLEDSIIEERAYWYLGNTYFQLNEIDEAKEAFAKAYDLNGAYSRVAQSYLKALSTI